MFNGFHVPFRNEYLYLSLNWTWKEEGLMHTVRNINKRHNAKVSWEFNRSVVVGCYDNTRQDSKYTTSKERINVKQLFIVMHIRREKEGDADNEEG